MTCLCYSLTYFLPPIQLLWVQTNLRSQGMTANSLWIHAFIHRSKFIRKEAWKSNYLAACDSFGYPEVAPRLEGVLWAHAEPFADFARSSLEWMVHTPSILTCVEQKKYWGENTPKSTVLMRVFIAQMRCSVSLLPCKQEQGGRFVAKLRLIINHIPLLCVKRPRWIQPNALHGRRAVSYMELSSIWGHPEFYLLIKQIGYRDTSRGSAQQLKNRWK